MILKIFLFWRVSLFFITYLGSVTIPKKANSGIGAIAPGKDFDYWASWAQWDGGHFLSISQRGHTTLEDYAFAPLYPFIIKFFHTISGLDELLIGLVISNVFMYLFLAYFYKYLKKSYSEQIAYTSTITFLTFPTTFFTVAYYSEALFLYLVVMVFYSLKQKKYLMSAIFVNLAFITRYIGVLLIISLIFSYFSRLKFKLNKIDKKIFLIPISLFVPICYFIYLFITKDDSILFITVQKSWQREINDPISTIFNYIFPIIFGKTIPWNDYLDLSLVLSFLVILMIEIRKIPSSLWIFSALSIIIPASTNTLTSMPRYGLVAIGVFVILGKLLYRNKRLRIFIWSVFLFMQAILAVLFINGHWVA